MEREWINQVSLYAGKKRVQQERGRAPTQDCQNLRVVQLTDKARDLGAIKVDIQDLGRGNIGLNSKSLAARQPPERVSRDLVVEDLHEDHGQGAVATATASSGSSGRSCRRGADAQFLLQVIERCVRLGWQHFQVFLHFGRVVFSFFVNGG